MNNRNINKRGFTLVELIVVMTIVVMLIGASVMGLSAFLKTSDFKKQNAYAESLFTAAQLQLTAYSQMGRLDSLTELESDPEHRVFDVASGATIINSNGDIVTAETLWSNADKKYQGTLVFIKGTAADYRAYTEGTLDDGAKVLLYELLEAYLYDKSILNATVCVELDPTDALIYSVMISETATDFVYQSNPSDSGVACILDRTISARKAANIGYFGVDSLSKVTSAKAQKPVISNLKLNNANTLNLSFKLSKVESAVLMLKYEIGVFSPNGSRIMTIYLNDGAITPDDDSDRIKNGSDTVVARVVIGSTVDESFVFPASYDSDTGYVTIVLDAADLGATEANYASTADIKNTFSFHRFGLDAENIYCTVGGSADGYKATAKKQSNVSHIYFGRYLTDVDMKTYTLYNARHLYNLRFSEKEYENETTTVIGYQLSASFSWADLISGGALYDNGMKIASSHAFPSFTALRNKSSLTTPASTRTYTVGGLVIDSEYNASIGLSDASTGLFLINRGMIKNVAFDGISVNGKTSVGAVCGENAGVLASLTVRNTNGTSSVRGDRDVGGIVGSQIDGTVSYNELVNRAEVTGYEYVGGIVGRLVSTAQENTISVSDCRNYGPVRGIDDPTDSVETAYIGGIVGYLEGVLVAGMPNTILTACVSSPQFDSDELFRQTGDSVFEVRQELLVGKYVGGIVGCCNNALINESDTVSEGGRSGWVVGHSFVGGIIGYNMGYTGSDSLYNLDGMEGAHPQSNQANVIGTEYVGGVVGANAELDAYGRPTSEPCTSLEISNWINEGVVLLISDGVSGTVPRYSGGIAGYNTGIITDCGSDVDISAIAGALSGVSNIKGDIVGGIAGYNNGTIKITTGSSVKVVSYVEGNNYIGGIVGLNDIESTITGYELRGGYIKGNTFVGGFAGLNVNSAVLDAGFVVANPNNVIGNYCVGAVIGGNIVSENNGINTAYNVHNILGSVSGKQFVGGIIGYNILLSEVQASAPTDPWQIALDNFTDIIGTGYTLETAKEKAPESEVLAIATLEEQLIFTVNKLMQASYPAADLERRVNELITALRAAAPRPDSSGNLSVAQAIIAGLDANEATYSASENQLLLSNIELLNNIRATVGFAVGETDTRKTDAVMDIGKSSTGEDENGLIIMRSISARVYVGGVIGYNDGETYLRISDITNRTQITAETAITANELPDGLYDKLSAEFGAFTQSYSYVGGVVGKVTENVIVSNFNNEGAGDVISSGTFTGGTTEINLGTIINCGVSSLGSSGKNFIGGIVGLNLAGAENVPFGASTTDTGIFDSRLEGTVTGNNFVGGIAAVNVGMIAEPSVELSTVIGYGSYVGGIVGYNVGGGSIRLDKTLDIVVSGGLRYTGGVIGYNDGRVMLSAEPSATVNTVGATGEISSVSGSVFVGGIIGYTSASDDISGYINRASVTAEQGSAAGIVGKVGAGRVGVTVRIINCKNYGSIQSAKSGNAGGIVADIESGFTVERCIDYGDVISSNGFAGGISGSNGGSIIDCSVLGSGARDVAVVGKEKVGAVCGINNSGALITGAVVDRVSVRNFSVGVNGLLGGVTGENLGTITLDAGQTSIQNITISTLANGTAAGGVAGKNSGLINSNTANSAAQIGTAQSLLGIKAADSSVTYGNFGGAVGINEGTVRDILAYAFVYGEKVGGDAIIPTNGYGGIAGENKEKALIVGCVFNGYVYANGAGSNISCVGGTAGINKGIVESSRVGTDSGVYTIIQCGIHTEDTDAGLLLRTAYGYVGGMVGFNHGTVLNCDNYVGDTQPTVYILNHSGHTGGIVGRNYNGAVVTGTDSTQKTATGANWIVIAQNFDNDCGTGGIMGYSASGKSVRFVDNHANVYYNLQQQSTQLCAAGFIARFENAESNDFEFYECNNYGNIYSRSGFIGGFVGSWKYNVGGLVNCTNYGAIGSLTTVGSAYGYVKDENGIGLYTGMTFGVSSSYCGGMVGRMFYAGGTDNSINRAEFTRCTNYGNVLASNNSAGILGYTAGRDTIYATFTDCVNFGYISGGTRGGICSAFDAIGGAKFVRCRNYSYFNNANSALISNRGTIVNCFSVSNANGSLSGNGNYSINIGNPPTTGAYLLPSGFNRAAYSSATEAGLNYRIGVASSLDSSFIENCNSSYTNTAQTLTVSNSVGHSFFVELANNNTAYAYRVAYQIMDGDNVILARDDSPVCDTNARGINVTVSEEYFGKGYEIIFYAAPINSNGTRVGEWTAGTARRSMNATLKTPDVILELVHVSGTSYKYRAVLNNPGDYLGLGEISIRYNNSYFRINVTEENIREVFASGATADFETGNTIITASASGTGYGSSTLRTVQTFTVKTTELKTTVFTALNDDGTDRFLGTTLSSVQYSANISKKRTSLEVYTRVELLAYDSALGMTIAYVGSELHTTENGQDMTALLSGLPDDLMTANSVIEIRSYPWSTQAMRTYFGHEVASGLKNKDELLAVRDNVISLRENGTELAYDDEGRGIFGSDGALKPGYVIQRESDGTYKVLFSIILYSSAADGGYTYQIDRCIYRIESNDIYKQDYKVVSSGGRLQYTITETLAYHINPTPVIKETDGTMYVYNPEDDTYTFIWDDGLYSGAQYNVTLYGVTEEGVRVEITADDAALPANQRQYTDNNWSYSGVELIIERLGSNDNNGNLAYFAATQTYFIDLQQRLPQISAPTVGFYEVDGIVEKNNLIYNISWTGVSNADLGSYEITVVYGDRGNLQTIVFNTAYDTADASHVSSIADALDADDVVIYSQSPDSTSAIVNLNAIAGSGSASVSVQAVAKDGSTAYRNSVTGVEREVSVPDRLTSPLLGDVEYHAQEVVSVSDFINNGVRFEITTSVQYAFSGKYEMVLEILDENSECIAYIDAVGVHAASAPLYDNPIGMTGNLSTASYDLNGLPSDYAGMNLRATIRTTANSAISSVWVSDPDLTFRLPRVYVDAVELSETTEEFTYLVGSGEQLTPYALNQTALTFVPVAHSDKYSICITRSPQKYDNGGDLDWRGYGVVTIVLVRNGNGFDVEYLETNGEQTRLSYSMVENGGFIDIPYSVTLDEGTDYSVRMNAKLAYSDGKMILVLPDCDSELSRPTQSVTVTSIAPEDTDRFVDSSVVCWYRTTYAGEEITVVSTAVSPQAPEISVSDITIQPEGTPERTLAIGITKKSYHLICRIENTVTGKLYEFAMPGVVDPTGVESLLRITDEATVRELQGNGFTLSFRYVAEQKDGVGEWTTVTGGSGEAQVFTFPTVITD